MTKEKEKKEKIIIRQRIRPKTKHIADKKYYFTLRK